jgi:hypothetical protein
VKKKGALNRKKINVLKKKIRGTGEIIKFEKKREY